MFGSSGLGRTVSCLFNHDYGIGDTVSDVATELILDVTKVLSKLKSRGLCATSLSTCDFSVLYTTLPHNVMKAKLLDLIERAFRNKGMLYLACNDKKTFFT